MQIPKNKDINYEKLNPTKLEKDSRSNPKFDSIWSDLAAGDQLLIGGLPRMGKSSVALNILNEVCINQNQLSAYFTFKSSTSELVKRLIAIRTNIYLSKIREGSLNDQELGSIMLQSKKISEATIYFDDSTKDIDKIIKSVKSLKNKSPNLKYIFIDYLQLLIPFSDEKEKIVCMNKLVSQLKKLAKEQNLIIITLVEIKKCEELVSSNPRIENFSDLNDFTQADQITLLNRWEYDSQERSKRNFDKNNIPSQNDIINFWTFKRKTTKNLLYVTCIDLRSRRIHNFDE